MVIRLGLFGLAKFFFLCCLVFLHTLKVVMVVVVGVVAVVVGAVTDAVVMMVMVMANIKVAVIGRIDIFECWLIFGDIGCNVVTVYFGSFSSSRRPRFARLQPSWRASSLSKVWNSAVV